MFISDNIDMRILPHQILWTIQFLRLNYHKWYLSFKVIMAETIGYFVHEQTAWLIWYEITYPKQYDMIILMNDQHIWGEQRFRTFSATSMN